MSGINSSNLIDPGSPAFWFNQPSVPSALASLVDTGDTLSATVVAQVAPGRYIINITGQQIAVDSRLMLSPGQQLELSVKQSGSKILMDLVGRSGLADIGRPGQSTDGRQSAKTTEGKEQPSDASHRTLNNAREPSRPAPGVNLLRPTPPSSSAHAVASDIRTSLLIARPLGELLDSVLSAARALHETLSASAVIVPDAAADAEPAPASSPPARIPDGANASVVSRTTPDVSGHSANLPANSAAAAGAEARTASQKSGQSRQPPTVNDMQSRPSTESTNPGPAVSPMGTSGLSPRQVTDIITAFLAVLPAPAGPEWAPESATGVARDVHATGHTSTYYPQGESTRLLPSLEPAGQAQQRRELQFATGIRARQPNHQPGVFAGLLDSALDLPARIGELLVRVEAAAAQEIAATPLAAAIARVIAELELCQLAYARESASSSGATVPASAPAVPPAGSTDIPDSRLNALLGRLIQAAGANRDAAVGTTLIPAELRGQLAALDGRELASLATMASSRETAILRSSPRLTALGRAHQALLEVQGRLALTRAGSMALTSTAASFSCIEIPLPGDPTRTARLRVTIGGDSASPGQKAGSKGRTFRAILDLVVSELGPVWVELLLHESTLAVRMQLSDAERRDHVASGVPELQSALAAAGLQAAVSVEAMPPPEARRSEEVWPEAEESGRVDLWA